MHCCVNTCSDGECLILINTYTQLNIDFQLCFSCISRDKCLNFDTAYSWKILKIVVSNILFHDLLLCVVSTYSTSSLHVKSNLLSWSQIILLLCNEPPDCLQRTSDDVAVVVCPLSLFRSSLIGIFVSSVLHVGLPGTCRSFGLTGPAQLGPECRFTSGTRCAHTEKDGSNDTAVEDHEQQTIRSFLPKQLWMLHRTLQVIVPSTIQIYFTVKLLVTLHDQSTKTSTVLHLALLAASSQTALARETQKCIETFSRWLSW